MGAGLGLNLPQPDWPEVQEPAQSWTTGACSSECSGDTPDPDSGGDKYCCGAQGTPVDLGTEDELLDPLFVRHGRQRQQPTMRTQT